MGLPKSTTIVLIAVCFCVVTSTVPALRTWYKLIYITVIAFSNTKPG